MSNRDPQAAGILADCLSAAGFPRNAAAVRLNDVDPFYDAIVAAMQTYRETAHAEGVAAAATAIENHNRDRVGYEWLQGTVWDQIHQRMAKILRGLIPARSDGMSALQANVGRWMVEVFGDDIAMDPLERIMRFTEEAVELGQALGLSRDETVRVVDYVYGRDVGEPRQEVGGVMITLAALCFRTGIDLDGAALDEFERIDSPDMRKRIFDKQAMKRAMGLTSDGGFRAAGGAA